MPAISYRLFFNNSPASQTQLDLVETIQVRQDVDMAWEARLEIFLSTSDQGKWQQEDQSILDDFGRVRIEVKIGADAYTPLIDGPIVGFDNHLAADPGRSVATVHVQDDSVFLNRRQEIESYDSKTDDQIARQLLQSIPQIASVQVDSVPAPDSRPSLERIRRGTPMAFLRRLARQRDMHAYVLPGQNPGESIGVFKKFPTSKDGLPDLILTGPDRNIGQFQIRNAALQPGSATTFTVSLTDGKVTRARSNSSQTERTGSQAGETDANQASYLPHPEETAAVDAQSAAQGRSDRSSYQFDVSGDLYTECYGKALAPYRIVTARGVNPKLSGDYTVTGVTHSIDRNTYKQTFRLRRNAISGAAGGTGPLGRLP